MIYNFFNESLTNLNLEAIIHFSHSCLFSSIPTSLLGLHHVSPHGFGGGLVFSTSLIVISPALISSISLFDCSSSLSCSSGIILISKLPLSGNLSRSKNWTLAICSKFLSIGISVYFHNAACCSLVSVPDKLDFDSWIFATLGGIPYFASMVYRFHFFISKSFRTSGLSVNC